MPVGANRVADIGAHPASASLTLGIDALHRETGQVLHRLSLQIGSLSAERQEWSRPQADERTNSNNQMMVGIVRSAHLCVKRKDH